MRRSSSALTLLFATGAAAAVQAQTAQVRHTKVHKPSGIDARSFAALLRQAAGTR